MRITELRAKVLELTGTFKCAVYADTNGVADRLLASSVDVVNATNGWNAFSLTSPLDLAGGDWYWLVIWSDTQGARVQADVVGVGYFGTYSFTDLAGAWPDPISLTTLLGDAAVRTYCIYSEGAPLGVGPGAEFDLRGNGKLIVSGDSTPSALDGTDFGSRNLGGDSQDRTFTIENPGEAPLTLTGIPPVNIDGPHASDWTVTSPPTSPVPPGGSSQFTVRFSPAAPGLRSATVSIGNNDADESPFQFAVQGAGLTTGRESIFPDTKIGRDIDFDGTYYELGTVFQSSVPGTITHLRVYSLASESGDHTARIWRNNDETVLGGPYTWNYGGVTGWITLDIPDVNIEAGIDYTVSISTGTRPKRNYPNIAADLTAAGGNGQHLTYPLNAGKFGEVRDARPTGSFNGGNYLRDIVFVPAGRESIFPDTKTGRDIDFDGTYYELGTVFQSSVPGTITHLRVYFLASDSGDHTARLWRNADETVLGGPYTWNYGGVTGWITLDIPDVNMEAGIDYTVSVSTGTSPKRNYPNIAADLPAVGGNGQHLTYPVNAGKFGEVRDARPTGSFNGGNYLRDIVFVPAGPESIFPDTKTGRDIDFDGTYYELGTVFQSSVPGTITHLRVYSLASESGDHTARIWRNADETVLGGPYTWNYGGVTGWITLDIPDVNIEAGIDYTVSVSTGTSPKRNYPNIAADLPAVGGNGQHLTYPVNAGKFGEVRDARPTGSFNGGNYLRDIVFVPAGPESIFPDTKTGRDIDFDGTYYELGTVFQSSVPGTITHLRVYSLASESGDHTARIWRNNDETVLGGPYTWN